MKTDLALGIESRDVRWPLPFFSHGEGREETDESLVEVAASAEGTKREKGTLSDQQAAHQVEGLDEVFRSFNYRLKFHVLQKGEIRIEVIDEKTDEVIRRIPPGELLRSLSGSRGLIGLVLDEIV